MTGLGVGLENAMICVVSNDGMTLTLAVFSVKMAVVVWLGLLAVLDDSSGEGLGKALGSTAALAKLLGAAVSFVGRAAATDLGAGTAGALATPRAASAGAAPTCRLRVLQTGVFFGFFTE